MSVNQELQKCFRKDEKRIGKFQIDQLRHEDVPAPRINQHGHALSPSSLLTCGFDNYLYWHFNTDRFPTLTSRQSGKLRYSR